MQARSGAVSKHGQTTAGPAALAAALAAIVLTGVLLGTGGSRLGFGHAIVLVRRLTGRLSVRTWDCLGFSDEEQRPNVLPSVVC